MELTLNIIVLAMEVLYYSLFMKFAKGEGKLWRYIVSFSLINILFYFIGTNKIYSYFLLILIVLYALKYIVIVKTTLFDVLIIIIMLLYKLILEFILTISLYLIFKNIYNIYVGAIIVSIIKIISLFLIKNKMNIFYYKINKLWNNNNFYIRYITSILILFYIIASCILLIVELI